MKKVFTKTDWLFLLGALLILPSLTLLVWTKYFPLWLGIPLMPIMICFLIYSYIDCKRTEKKTAEWEILHEARSKRLDELEAMIYQEPESPRPQNYLERYWDKMANRLFSQMDKHPNPTIH